MGGGKEYEDFPVEEYMTRKTILSRPGSAQSNEYYQPMSRGNHPAASINQGPRSVLTGPQATMSNSTGNPDDHRWAMSRKAIAHLLDPQGQFPAMSSEKMCQLLDEGLERQLALNAINRNMELAQDALMKGYARAGISPPFVNPYQQLTVEKGIKKATALEEKAKDEEEGWDFMDDAEKPGGIRVVKNGAPLIATKKGWFF